MFVVYIWKEDRVLLRLRIIARVLGGALEDLTDSSGGKGHTHTLLTVSKEGSTNFGRRERETSSHTEYCFHRKRRGSRITAAFRVGTDLTYFCERSLIMLPSLGEELTPFCQLGESLACCMGRGPGVWKDIIINYYFRSYVWCSTSPERKILWAA